MHLGSNEAFGKNQVIRCAKTVPCARSLYNAQPILRIMRRPNKPLSKRVNDDRPSDQCSIDSIQHTHYKSTVCFPIKKPTIIFCLTRLRVFKAIRLRTVYRTKGSIISRRWRPVWSCKNAYRAFAECPLVKTF